MRSLSPRPSLDPSIPRRQVLEVAAALITAGIGTNCASRAVSALLLESPPRLNPARRFEVLYPELSQAAFLDIPESGGLVLPLGYYKNSRAVQTILDKYNTTDRVLLEIAALTQTEILSARKQGLYPPKITEHLLKLFKGRLKQSNFEERIDERIYGPPMHIFGQLNKLKQLGYLTDDEIDELASDSLMKGIVDPDEPGGRFQLLMKGGLEIGDRKAGFRYVANLMDAVIKKITQVLETTPKLDGKDDIRWTILGYASSVLFSEDDSKKKESFYHSPADRLRLLVKILQDLEDPKKGLQSSDIHKIIRSPENIKLYMKWNTDGLEAIRQLP